MWSIGDMRAQLSGLGPALSSWIPCLQGVTFWEMKPSELLLLPNLGVLRSPHHSSPSRVQEDV